MTGTARALLFVLFVGVIASGRDMETTLRFEAVGDDIRFQSHPELGTLLQWGERGEHALLYSRSTTGELARLAAGWDPKLPFEDVFTTSDGERWVQLERQDVQTLRRWDGSAWREVSFDGDKGALAAHKELRRGAVHLDTRHLRADDGTDYLLDSFGVATYRKGVWHYGNVQVRKSPPVDWKPIVWRPEGGRLHFALGKREAPDETQHVRLAKGAWASLRHEAVAVSTSGGTVTLPLKHARALATRGEKLLVCAWVGDGWDLLAVDTSGGIEKVGHEPNALDAPDQVGQDSRGRVWFMDRHALRVWDDRGVRSRERDFEAWFLGFAADRALFRGQGLVFSVSLEELDRDFERASPAADVLEDSFQAASLDAEKRLRAPRPVPPFPEEKQGLGVHRKGFFRFHVRKGGEWVLDESSPTYEVRSCALHWCRDCHGGAKDRPRPPKAAIETRPPGFLDAEGRVWSRVGSSENRRDASSLIRRPDGTTWLLGPAGLVEIVPLATDRWRPQRVRLFARSGPWFQDRDGDVWLHSERRIERIVFPK